MYNQNDDLKYAIKYNGLGKELKEEELEQIVAEVPGHNDEDSWFWIVRLTNGKFVYLTGGCDYTGWDCQSSLSTGEIVATAELAVEQAPEKDYQKEVRNILLKQLAGKIPVGTYELTQAPAKG